MILISHPKMGYKGQKTEDRVPRAEDRGQMAENGMRKSKKQNISVKRMAEVRQEEEHVRDFALIGMLENFRLLKSDEGYLYGDSRT